MPWKPKSISALFSPYPVLEILLFLILRTRLYCNKFITQPSCVPDFDITEISQPEIIIVGSVQVPMPDKFFLHGDNQVLKRHFVGAGRGLPLNILHDS